MSKKLKREKEDKFEELNKIADALVTNTRSDLEREFLEKMNQKPKKDRSKNLDQKLRNYRILIECFVDWNSRHAYLNLLR